MRTNWNVVVGILLAIGAGAAAEVATGLEPYESGVAPTPIGAVDEAVFGQLRALGVRSANLCTDGVFVRRAYLDVIGTLPTALEAREFILDRDPEKRRRLVDRLLEREEYADYWALKWGDLLRVKSEYPINLWPNAVQAYHRWIRTSLRENVAYDQFARELLTSSGSNFRVAPVNFYRAMQNREPQGIARTVALTFMGARAERWPTQQLAGMAGFFSCVGYKSTGEWKEEIVFFDPAQATNALLRQARFPAWERGVGSGQERSGRVLVGPSGGSGSLRDPREQFADWLIRAENPWFARSLVNRVWSWLLGRGIVHEPDDLRPDNPPGNPELLAVLEREFVAGGWDMKKLFRLILTSQTYQLAAAPGAEAAGGGDHFGHYRLRRLEAEVLVDAVCQVTGSSEAYSSPIPEPFTYVPEGQRSIALGDGSITSSFLDLFGRPSRDTGLELERNSRPSAAQRLHLLNSSQVQRKIEQSPMVRYQLEGRKTPREVATGMYLGMLSRFPTEVELKAVEEYFQVRNTARREAVVDLAWVLVNCAEFSYRH